MGIVLQYYQLYWSTPITYVGYFYSTVYSGVVVRDIILINNTQIQTCM